MIVKEDLWELLCKLMHQLAIRNGSIHVMKDLDTHWIYNNGQSDICLVCNKKISQSVSNVDNYDHAKQHAKEYGLLILL